MRSLVLMCGLSLTLVACGEKPVEKPPEPEFPKVTTLGGVDLTQRLSVVGTEPFWALTLTDESLVLERPDFEDETYPRHAFEKNDPTKEGEARAELITNEISLTLTARKCSDGMSDRVYPLTAELTKGDELLKGCALTTDALNKYRP